jgi:class I fructose-bisphosphate aldolase
MKKGVLYLAYDQGLEHGPSEFNDKNVNPAKIIEIAQKGRYDAVIFQKGIAEKYNDEIKKSKVPLIIKLNGKTNLYKGEPMSEQICSVDEAIKLGAIAVGYTIYVGSEFESKMLKEFAKIEEEAHNKGLQVIAWIYPRGKAIASEKEDELMAYSARVGLEIGADMVKLKYSGNPNALKWAVKAAGKCKIVVAGGTKKEEKEFLQQMKEIINCGVAGIAVGRNVWQNDKPIAISKKIRRIVKGK